MRFTAFLLACAHGALAVNYAEWLQHNGLASEYNRISKEHGPFIQSVESEQSITAFVPTNDGMKKWLDENPNVSYQTIQDTFKYMITTKGAYKLSELVQFNRQKLPTMLQGQQVEIYAEGASPDVTIVVGSGGKYKSNSTAGIANMDFVIENGYVQLVSEVFNLPKNIFQKDQQSKKVSAAPKATLGAGFLLSALTIGAMAIL